MDLKEKTKFSVALKNAILEKAPDSKISMEWNENSNLKIEIDEIKEFTIPFPEQFSFLGLEVVYDKLIETVSHEIINFNQGDV